MASHDDEPLNQVIDHHAGLAEWGVLLLGKGGGPATGRGTSPGAAALKLFTGGQLASRT